MIKGGEKRMSKSYAGLQDVIATDTNISLLDINSKKIVIRGHDLIDLSQKKEYLDVVHLLLEGEFLSDEEGKALDKELRMHGSIPEEIMEILSLLPKQTHPMDAQRTGISVLANYDERLDDRTNSINKQRAYQLIAKIPTITVNSYRVLNNEPIIEPREDLSYSANFLYMITGKIPSKMEEEIFDKSLLLYSEHELPNSTFTARVIASTNSDLYGALTGAVASLKGNLHGGANEAVMYMLNEARSVAGFEQLMYAKLKNNEKIMGFGHRVYMKQIDPRATRMKESLKTLSEQNGDDILLKMCEAGEKVMLEEKGLYPNLDYYAAPVYWKLNIPIPLYTPIFLSARTAGICAHVMEQHANNRIYRPRVNYTGEAYC